MITQREKIIFKKWTEKRWAMTKLQTAWCNWSPWKQDERGGDRNNVWRNNGWKISKFNRNDKSTAPRSQSIPSTRNMKKTISSKAQHNQIAQSQWQGENLKNNWRKKKKTCTERNKDKTSDFLLKTCKWENSGTPPLWSTIFKVLKRGEMLT